jgi:hypothetical protein
MTNSHSYPDSCLNILNDLENAEKNKGISEGREKSYFGRPSWWTFIDGIELRAPSMDIYNSLGEIEHIQPPSSLREFLSVVCKGNLDEAVAIIDSITKNVAFMVDMTNQWDQLHHLQMIGDFLRDVRGIIRSSKHRRERYADHEALLPKPSRSAVDTLYPDSGRVIGSQFRDHPKAIHAVIDNRPIGPGRPSFIVAGFCLVCHRICDQKQFYCLKHRRSSGTDSDIKSSRRMINTAFSNLGMTLPFEHSIDINELTDAEVKIARNTHRKNLGISKDRAFKIKCYLLEGWAMHRPEHQIFHKKIKAVIEGFLSPEFYNSWSAVPHELFNEIAECMRGIQHVEKIFHDSFYITKSCNSIFDTLSSQVFKTCDGASFTPTEAIDMLYRMSQIGLIHLASKNRLDCKVISTC